MRASTGKKILLPDCPRAIKSSNTNAARYGRMASKSKLADATKSRIGITAYTSKKKTPQKIAFTKASRQSAPRKLQANYNRCGTPISEMVSEPDMRHARERAYAYLNHAPPRFFLYTGRQRLQLWKKANLRCRTMHNVSVRQRGSKELRHQGRSRLKNLQLLPICKKRGIRDRAPHRIPRIRRPPHRAGGRASGTQPKANSLMRSKEKAQDYRYFPEPEPAPRQRQRSLAR